MFDQDPSSDVKSKKSPGKRDRIPIRERPAKERPSDQVIKEEQRQRSLEARSSPREKLPGVSFKPETQFHEQKKRGPSQLASSKSYVAKNGPSSPEKVRKVN